MVVLVPECVWRAYSAGDPQFSTTRAVQRSLWTGNSKTAHYKLTSTVMLTGTTSKEETKEIFSRLTSYDPATAARDEKEIKLCYVTVLQLPCPL